jgi:hypothetical protein
VFRLSALGSRGHFMQSQEKRSSMRSCVEHVVSVSLEGGEDGKSGYIHGKSYVSEPKCVMRCENTGRITCVISERDVVASGSAR